MASDKLRDANAVDEEGAEMDMSPMIDMVFLLLIFFIVVSTPMIVKQDPKVKPAVAYNALDPEIKKGRIVLNVRDDGSYTPVNFKNKDESENVMTESAEITQYVSEQINKLKELGYRVDTTKADRKIRLHLRGDNRALFKYSQKAIKASAEAGLDKVIFSVFPFEKK